MTDRFVRQADFVPRSQLRDLTVSVIGIGAIGRQVALQLAAIGVPRLQLVDFDVVEASNLTTQGYVQSDLGMPKVEACRHAIERIDGDVEVETVCDRFRPALRLGEAVVCCVDTISARAAIWRAAGSCCRFWSDGRMLGETIRIVTAADDASRGHYPSTLFAQSDAEPGRCTSRSTIYTAGIAAGLMVHQFTRWLRSLSIDANVLLNLLASEMSVGN